MALAMPYGNPQPAAQGSYQNPQEQQARDRLNSGYQTYLGRDMGEADWQSQTTNGTRYADSNVNYALNNIRNSPEAQAYANRNQNQPPPAATGPDTTGVTNNGGGQNVGGGPPAAPGVPQVYSGAGLQQAMSAARANAPSITSQYQPQTIKDFQ